jgi:hypothetical protein
LFYIFVLQKHFDAAQFESHRQDGVRKLRPDAVPMLFETSTAVVDHHGKRKESEINGIITLHVNSDRTVYLE